MELSSKLSQFAHQRVYDASSQKVVATEILLRSYRGTTVREFNENLSLFEKHNVPLVEQIAVNIKALTNSLLVPVYLVNFTPNQISSPEFISTLQSFYKLGLVPSNIAIEITESLTPKDPKQLLKNIDIARNLGHIIAVDDFGDGNSNFGKVMELKPNIIKFDKSILDQAITSDYDQTVLVSLVRFCHDIDTKVIIEGIETKEMYDLAKYSKADMLQGYHLTKPDLIIT